MGYYIGEDGKTKRKRVTKSGFKTKKSALEYIDNLKNFKKEKFINFETLWENFKNGTYMQLSKSKKTAYNIAWKKIRSSLCYKYIGEILTIQKSNINLEEQYLTGGIKTEKGKKRKIIIPDKAMPVLCFLMENSKTDKLSTYNEDNFYND